MEPASRGPGFAAGPSQGPARLAPELSSSVISQRGGVAKIRRRPVHGVLLLDKPLGLSSNQALQKVKWLMRAEKAGHTGTLDPLATGVLPLCFGAATKFSQLHLDADKSYEAVAQLGLKTSTADAEGEIIATRPVQFTPAQLDQAVAALTGEIWQVPPMYSAIKKDGRALYEYAREGIEIDRKARKVTIYELKVPLAGVNIASNAIKFIAKCSKGTYIRTLGEDLGEALGCGAHLTALRRIQTGPFEQKQCTSLEALEAMTDVQRMACLLPVDALLSSHSQVILDSDNAGRFLSGMRRRGPWPDAEAVAVYSDEPRALLGTGHVKAGELIPGRLLSPLEVQASLEQKLSN
jgi:tRNA pseudouridine55 synthase